jgi:hypothetical protein
MKRSPFSKVPITLVLTALTLGTVLAANGSLPGGTPIGVTIDNPSDGMEIMLPSGQTTVDVEVIGTASIGEGGASPDTTLIYVLDASSSTSFLAGVDCGPDQQTDDPLSREDETIDCEIAAAINLNDVAITLGPIDEVAMIVFASQATAADATPAGGDDPLIPPAADANANGINDVDEVLRSIKVGGFFQNGGFVKFTAKELPDSLTDYAEAIREAINVAALATNPNVVVVFISDGVSTEGDHVTEVLPAGDVVFHTFAISDEEDNCSLDLTHRGSLQDIADLTGGTCTEVEDPSALPDVLPGAIIPTLDSLEITVDGGEASTITNADIDPDLPQEGPMTVSYNTTVSGLGVGDHEICVTANGKDALGSGDVTECVTIHVRPTTAIDLVSFAATASETEVRLTWETAGEINNEGFNLWRSQAADGQYTRLNATLIPAQGDADTGASYEYTDTNVVKGVIYYYKLEDIDIHGVSAFHGPVSATPSPIRRIYLPLILK